MASKLGYYGQFFPFLNGELLSESSSVDFGNENKDQDVETLVKNFSGITPGSDKMMITVKLHEPTVGSSVAKLQELELSKEVVKFGLKQTGEGKQLTSEGYIRNVQGNSAVGANSEITFQFVGTPNSFK
jgi:hypothetical protein